MKLAMPVVTILFLSLSRAASAQVPDMEAIQKWSNATVVHYEVVGVINDKHVQIPPKDADLYGDVTDRVTLSFDWDRTKHALVGTVAFTNQAATVTNLVAIEKGCPVGSLKGPYEHFDIVEAKASKTSPGTIELVGKRVHPDTMVTQACGSKPTPFSGGVTPQTEYIAPLDPIMLVLGASQVKTLKVSADGKSLIMTALNNNWTWTFTPSVKAR